MPIDYQKVLKEPFPTPKAGYGDFSKSVIQAISDFKVGNSLISRLEKGTFSLADYHKILVGIFHQVYFSSASFALAASGCSSQFNNARNYLIHHAEEEKEHWMWILEDLDSTSYSGPDPRSLRPNWATQAYLSYGMHLAVAVPVGRLAMASVLEGISGSFGGELGGLAAKTLNLKKSQLKFFLAHGELDQGHSQDIVDVLKESNLNPQEWGEMVHAAQVTTKLYKNLYNVAIE